jgi:hypothetical protein
MKKIYSAYPKMAKTQQRWHIYYRRDISGTNYFFVKPAGHLGEMAVTFLTIFPFRQVSVVVTTFFAGALATTACFSWVNFTRMVGVEKVKFLAERNNHSRLASSRTVSVPIICSLPSAFITETDARNGAFENP